MNIQNIYIYRKNTSKICLFMNIMNYLSSAFAKYIFYDELVIHLLVPDYVKAIKLWIESKKCKHFVLTASYKMS